MEEINKGRR